MSQCRRLFEQREELKPLKERRACPSDPLQGLASGPLTHAQVERVNAAAMETWSSAALATCQWCGRSFLPEKIAIHNRSCTQDNPARRVTDPVNRRVDAAAMAPLASMASSSSSAVVCDNAMQASMNVRSSGLSNTVGNNLAGGAIRSGSRGKSNATMDLGASDFSIGNLNKCPHCSRTFNEIAFQK